jgi:hypothetical protein
MVKIYLKEYIDGEGSFGMVAKSEQFSDDEQKTQNMSTTDNITAKKCTKESLRAFLESRLENEAIPAAVLEVARELAGKPCNSRQLAKLPNLNGFAFNRPNEWRFRKEYGMTHLETSAYSARETSRHAPRWGATDDAEKFSFLICHTETGAMWPDVERFKEKGSPYYRGTDERNLTRRSLIGNPDKLDECAAVIREVVKAQDALKSAKKALHAFTDYGEPLNPDSYHLDAFGVEK